MTAQPRSTDVAANEPVAGQKAINLALQGGGSHGAFTWGVIDRLLEDERIAFEGITATSAGGVNAVLLLDGWIAGGREGAKNALKTFWKKMSDVSSKSIIAPSFLDKMSPKFGLDQSPGYVMTDMISRFLSPYQLNPFDMNPMRDLLNEVVDFERIQQHTDIKLFLSATTVRTGKVKVFTNKEITANHVIASACLPFVMRAPEIEGEIYWDGGFMGNPAIFPVIYGCKSCDVLMVHLTPMVRNEFPTDSRSILNRMQEISFNSSLMREMRAIAFVTQLIDEGKLSGGKRMFMHLIEAEDIITELAGSSKMNADWKFLMHLFNIGRERADAWIAANFDRVGRESTVDIQERWL
ncbi:MAG TPA: patatin-like phospholipase family protein [Xanthobacteraceae bacterium]|nr:patatin-like phospholipase family protein [Xanthobacteraceae bacterium]